MEPTRCCSRCFERKPWSAFRLHRGTPHCHCRECERVDARARAKARYDADPEAARRRLRDRYALERADPERMALRLMKQRDHRGIPSEDWQGPRLHRTGATLSTVPAAPFADWLRPHFGHLASLAEVADVGERILRRVLNGEQDNVSIDTVDRVLLAEGTTDLCDLYPLAA